jgi:predicted RNA-binding Zn ribbon-like protein
VLYAGKATNHPDACHAGHYAGQMAALTPDPLALATALLNRTAGGSMLTQSLLVEAAIDAGYDGVRITEADADLVASVLPAQRRVFGAGNEADAIDVVNGLLRLAPVRPRLVTGAEGLPTLAMHAPDDAFGVIYLSDFSLAAAALAAQGQIGRLQRCAAQGCSDVFVDRSRARGRRYCDMRTCGNRTNVAAYRERQRRTPGSRRADT